MQLMQFSISWMHESNSFQGSFPGAIRWIIAILRQIARQWVKTMDLYKTSPRKVTRTFRQNDGCWMHSPGWRNTPKPCVTLHCFTVRKCNWMDRLRPLVSDANRAEWFETTIWTGKFRKFDRAEWRRMPLPGKEET